MFRLRSWVRKLSHQLSLPAPRIRRPRTYPPGKRVQPRLEDLEPLMLLSTVTWTGAAGDNNWDTGGNWSTGNTPGAGDDAVINVASPTTITHSAAVTDTINSLTSNAAIVLSGGTLNVNTTLNDSAGLTLQGGTLGNATVQSGTTLTGTAAGGTLSGVANFGILDLQTNNNAAVTVTNGLLISGSNAISVGNTSGTTHGILTFSGSQTVTGMGVITFGASSSNQINLDSTLTIAAGDIISDGQGTIQGGSGTTLVNQGFLDGGGTISVGTYTQTGGSTTLTGGTLKSASGTIQINGGSLGGTGTLGSNVTIATGATLSLGQVSGSLAVAGGLLLDGSLNDTIAGTQIDSAGGYE